MARPADRQPRDREGHAVRVERPLSLLLYTNILIDVLRGERAALVWLVEQHRPAISAISWVEMMVGCRPEEAVRVEEWLRTFIFLPLDNTIVNETVPIRQKHGIKVPDEIILATARSHGFLLATGNFRDFSLTIGGIDRPYCV